MLTKDTIKTCKAKLEKTQAELQSEIKKLEIAPDYGHDTDHFEEAAEEVEEFSKNMGIEQTFKERLNDVAHALSKIAAGTYGACEKCHKEIELKILEIDPESRFCRECKINR